ncbi:hypothetical protein DFQ28_001955 [Apophysomyces sp. BC1034]|nr:hypothetical protein DFQ30_002320 [Apophysomyces sp. BC1015]KAG0179973.1 hypothetical protein DFQ29_001418 [Apophysomyces sp. BC1021]KAG0190516.1 hypothetical protein DFQ28_001955 [Apophysomyces sp. BC1034]
MRLPSSLSLTAIGLLVLSSAQFNSAEQLGENDLAVTPEPVSAMYLAPFATDENEPEPEFELVDDDYDGIDVQGVSSMWKRGDNCAKYHKISGGDTCIKLSKENSITLNQFYQMNPHVNKKCTNLHNGKKYCVQKGSSGSSSKKTSGSKSKATSSSGGCSKHHNVESSDTCASLAKRFKISLDDFYKWNPQVHHNCDNLDDGKDYCVQAGSSSSNNDDDDDISDKVTSFASKTKKKSKSKSKGSSSSSSESTEKRRKIQSSAAFTYYWIAKPSNYKGGKTVAVKTCGGKTIGNVNEKYADALVMEGTGVVGNKIVNLGSCSCTNYKCFEEVSKKDDPYGLTAYGTALRPYVTVAANDLGKNAKIYVPALVGWTLPGTNKKHNGCLLVDDQSWSFSKHHIDLYVYDMDNYRKLDKDHRTTKVDIFEGGSCKLLNYYN